MPNQPLINALMGGQLGQQQPFGSNIFGTNNQQWGSGGTEQVPQTYQQEQTASPWPQENSQFGGQASPWGNIQLGGATPFGQQMWQALMQMMGNRGGLSAFFGSQPRMQPPTGMPQGWGQGPWGQQGGQG